MIGKNNPFNLRYYRRNYWKGCLGSNKGFTNFQSRQYGIRAAMYLLYVSYRRIGIDTIDGIIHRFAPTIENDTQRYITFVCNQTGYPCDKHLCLRLEYNLVLHAMSLFEGNPVVLQEITHCMNHFDLRLHDCSR